MVQPAPPVLYTQVAQRYNQVCLVFIVISSISSLLIGLRDFIALPSLVEVPPFFTESFGNLTIAIASSLAILGLRRQRWWSKWLVIGIYSITIVFILEALLSSFISKSALLLGLNQTPPAFQVLRILVILAQLLGIALLFPKLGNRKSST
jgi:hypothetical protein